MQQLHRARVPPKERFVANQTWEQAESTSKKTVPEGLWVRCVGCGETVFGKTLEQNLEVCPKCDHHHRVSAAKRVAQLVDPGSFEPFDEDLAAADPLGFVDVKPYRDRIDAARRKSGANDGCLTGVGFVKGRKIVVGAMDFTFLGGSMGSVVGERLTRLIEWATEQELPLIIISGSGGGARMHEGILSLMQMAKVSAALARYDEAGGLFISVLTNPTMGGVAASFASLGDLVFAEPKALIGFAGPRTIKATIGIELPEGFQTSEFLLEHGYIDRIVERKNLKTEIARAIDYCGK